MIFFESGFVALEWKCQKGFREKSSQLKVLRVVPKLEIMVSYSIEIKKLKKNNYLMTFEIRIIFWIVVEQPFR